VEAVEEGRTESRGGCRGGRRAGEDVEEGRTESRGGCTGGEDGEHGRM